MHTYFFFIFSLTDQLRFLFFNIKGFSCSILLVEDKKFLFHECYFLFSNVLNSLWASSETGRMSMGGYPDAGINGIKSDEG